MKANVIRLDPQNARVHDQQNKTAIRQSLSELGAGRSVLVDKDNVLIAGNGVYEQAQELGIPLRIIESDGRELVIIKRTDLGTTDEKRKALAIADNRTSELSFFDDNALAELISTFETENLTTATGFSDDEIQKILATVENEIKDGNDATEDNPDKDLPLADAQCVMGPYKFVIKRDEWLVWIESIRQAVGFDDVAIVSEIRRRLKV